MNITYDLTGAVTKRALMCDVCAAQYKLNVTGGCVYQGANYV